MQTDENIKGLIPVDKTEFVEGEQIVLSKFVPIMDKVEAEW